MQAAWLDRLSGDPDQEYI